MVDEPLTPWAKLEVQRMIDVTLKEYGIIQEQRHRENSQKLDRNARETLELKDLMNTKIRELDKSNADRIEDLKTAITESNGVKSFIRQWIPTGIMAALALGSLIVAIMEVTKH
jgi:beta-phosphoglucomutase-like phosphatase (HAD superfamily)